MRTLIIILFSVLIFNCTGKSEPITNQEKLVAISEEILENLVAGKYEKIAEHFDQKMKESLSPDQLKAVYEGLKANVGEFKEKGEVLTENYDMNNQKFRIVYIIMKFEKAPFKLQVVFDEDDLVAGLFLKPVTAK